MRFRRSLVAAAVVLVAAGGVGAVTAVTADAASSRSVTSNGVKVTASASARTATVGRALTVRASVRSAVTREANVALTVFDASGSRVGGTSWPATALPAGRTLALPFSWTAPAAGAYRVSVVVTAAPGGALLVSNARALRFSARAGVTPATPPADTGSTGATTTSSTSATGSTSPTVSTVTVSTTTAAPTSSSSSSSPASSSSSASSSSATSSSATSSSATSSSATSSSAPATTATSAPATSGSSAPAHFSDVAPGGTLPSGAQCAAWVRSVPAPAEVKSVNAAYNARTGHAIAGATGLDARVDGNFTGTTEQILRWAACKWGVDENVVKAQAAVESWWRMDTKGDLGTDASRCAPGHGLGVDGTAGQCPESWGLLQVRYPYNQAAFPDALQSSAFNLDYAYARYRACYTGEYTWLNTVEHTGTYAAGDQWGCLGVWFSGRWHTAAAEGYISRVKGYQNQQIWTTASFDQA